MTPAAGFGEIGMGLLRAIEPWNQWIAGWGFDMADGEPDLSTEASSSRSACWSATRTWRSRSNGPPSGTSTRRTRSITKGRVFCGGDAVHRHPPTSGLGSNTCMQDAFNLAWKLAFVVKGHAGPGLLESYRVERAPVGAQIVARANQSRLDYAPLTSASTPTPGTDPVAAGLAKLRAPGPEGAAVRDALWPRRWSSRTTSSTPRAWS